MNIEKKQICVALFIDLKSAFDTIDHQILIDKLDHYGVRCKALSMLSSYLKDRKQFIKAGDIESSILHVLCGVPQGSVLGPLLFIIQGVFFFKVANRKIDKKLIFGPNHLLLGSIYYKLMAQNDKTRLS